MKPRDIQVFLFNEIQCGLPIREPTMQQLDHFIHMEKKRKYGNGNCLQDVMHFLGFTLLMAFFLFITCICLH
jgi:hypothetical protein